MIECDRRVLYAYTLVMVSGQIPQSTHAHTFTFVRTILHRITEQSSDFHAAVPHHWIKQNKTFNIFTFLISDHFVSVALMTIVASVVYDMSAMDAFIKSYYDDQTVEFATHGMEIGEEYMLQGLKMSITVESNSFNMASVDTNRSEMEIIFCSLFICVCRLLCCWFSSFILKWSHDKSTRARWKLVYIWFSSCEIGLSALFNQFEENEKKEIWNYLTVTIFFLLFMSICAFFFRLVFL